VCIGISVISLGKVPVEGCHDGIFSVYRCIMPCPLPDAWAAGIGQHNTSNGSEGVQKTIALSTVYRTMF
jgi:hypothetical protein